MSFMDGPPGVETVSSFSFEEEKELGVASIPPERILSEAIRAVEGKRADCVFVSCTNLRAVEVVAEVERATGVPCLCSNLCLLWRAARLCGAELSEEFRSRLTDKDLPKTTQVSAQSVTENQII